MCTAIKAKDVTLITIAFDLNDSETETRLSNCSASSDYFFDADNNAQLASAIESIAALLKQRIHASR